MKSPLSPKQIDSYLNSNRRLSIWEGAVRSGKSFVSLLRFIKAIKEPEGGAAMIVGVSRDALQRNVIMELCALLGIPCPTPKSTQMTIYNRVIHFVGANDERAQRRIQGSTIRFAYVDEVTLIPQGFFKMLLSRMSLPGAQLFGTTNPDSPFHWLKTEFLDNPDLDLTRFKFRISDNPSLTEDYVRNISKEYTGLWYKRYIEGEWVLAEGTVYDFFDESDHVITCPPGPADYYVVGIDYGTANPTAFTLVGFSKRFWPNVWCEDEYFYDSRKTGRQKTDTEYVEDLKRFITGKNVRCVYVDPSAASFKLEMMREGLAGIMDADNDVINGIRTVSKFLSNGTFKVCGKCKNLIREFQTYRWDTKAGERGEDKPIKEFDHCFVAGTMVLTDRGNVPIEEIQKGDMVRTLSGVNRVLETFTHMAETNEFQFMGSTFVCTPEHKFLTDSGWKEACHLIQSDMLYIDIGDESCGLPSSSTEEHITDIQNLKTSLIACTSKITNVTCTEIFTNFIMEKFHPDTIFITKTGTSSTTTLAISNAYWLQTIFPSMLQVGQTIEEKRLENIVKESGLLPKNGIPVKWEENGIESMQKKALGPERSVSLSANTVEENSLLSETEGRLFVRMRVSLPGGETLDLMTSLRTVHAESDLAQISTKKINTVLENAGPRLENREVHNLHIENEHCFFANNVLVHNCLDSLRYNLFSHFRSILTDDFAERDMEKIYSDACGFKTDLPQFFRDTQGNPYDNPAMPAVNSFHY